jgi:NaMN:DMB phosphoribosyltransferase
MYARVNGCKSRCLATTRSVEADNVGHVEGMVIEASGAYGNTSNKGGTAFQGRRCND